MPTALAEGCCMSERSFPMPLPPVAFFSIYEIAVRWGCPPADVAGWAAAGHLHVVAATPPVSGGEEPVPGWARCRWPDRLGGFGRWGPGGRRARTRRGWRRAAKS